MCTRQCTGNTQTDTSKRNNECFVTCLQHYFHFSCHKFGARSFNFLLFVCSVDFCISYCVHCSPSAFHAVLFIYLLRTMRTTAHEKLNLDLVTFHAGTEMHSGPKIERERGNENVAVDMSPLGTPKSQSITEYVAHMQRRCNSNESSLALTFIGELERSPHIPLIQY